MSPPSAYTIMTPRRGYDIYRSLLIIVSLSIFIDSSQQHYHNGNLHKQLSNRKAMADVKPTQQTFIQILIPNLPPSHYQYWLKNHPRSAKVFESICQQVESRLPRMNDLAEFQMLHHNLSFEDPQYIHNLEYGKQVLNSICFKIRNVSKSCWGYENNCQDIYMMPECTRLKDSQETMSDEERKILFFNQADFGFILDRARELGKYCTPDKKNATEVSSLECTRNFTTCRGQNLYLQFNTSALSNQRLSDKLTAKLSVLSEVGGWGCDLQEARIKEVQGRDGWLESWHGELKSYHRVDKLEPVKTCDITEDKQVFFIKIESSSNLYDYLSSFINLYATIHLNNKFSEDNKIVIWSSHLPRDRTFGHLWYAFSRLPPISIGQYDGKKVCFKKFIFVMPPKMRDGLDIDKNLTDGCSKSGFYDAFHRHIIHRLRISNPYDSNFHRKTDGKLLRITILRRSSQTEYRNILNENELEQTLKNQTSDYLVRVVPYNSMDFGHVVQDVLNSDILIGLHGSGLAYSLFLPDWASLIELHDCGKDRYQNLARLRGINYFKQKGELNLVNKIQVPEESKYWSDLKQRRLLNHDEYSNYEVNLDQFMRLFAEARNTTLESRDNYFRKPRLPGNSEDSITPQPTLSESKPPPTTVPTPTDAPKQQLQPSEVASNDREATESTNQEHNEL